MENLNKNQMKYLLAAVVLIIFIIIFFMSGSKSASNTTESNKISTNTTTGTDTGNKTVSGTKTNTVAQTSNQKCNLKITSPIANSKVSFPITVKGILDVSGKNKYPCTWGEKQQSAGTIQLFYNVNGTGWRPSGIPVSIFTEGTVSTSTLNITSSGISLNSYALGVYSGTPIKLTFEDFNFGNTSLNTFDIVVYLK